MRGNMLQTWTPAWLVLTALLAVGVVATTTGRVTPAEGRPLVEPTNRIAHCALPAALVQRAERARVPSPRGAAAMLVLLMAHDGRLAGLAR